MFQQGRQHPTPFLTGTTVAGDFVVEQAKTARAFLKALPTETPLQQIAIQELNEHTPHNLLPELLEPLLHLLTQAPLTGEIEIHKGGLRIQTEVTIAYVAPADQRQLAIHQQQLVVHPVVDAAKAEQSLQQQCQRAPATQPEGVE